MQRKCTVRALVLLIKRITLFEIWSNIYLFQSFRKCASFRWFINTISQNRRRKLTFFQDTCWYIPADWFVVVKTFNNLFHIVYRSILRRKFTSNTQILFAVMMGWFANFINPLSANPTKWSNTVDELFEYVWPFCVVGA